MQSPDQLGFLIIYTSREILEYTKLRDAVFALNFYFFRETK